MVFRGCERCQDGGSGVRRVSGVRKVAVGSEMLGVFSCPHPNRKVL